MEQHSEGSKAGRPKSEFFDFQEEDPDWSTMVNDMYEEGASDVEIKAYISTLRGSFSNDLWYRWMDEEPEFSETIKNGRLQSEAWWQRNGREELRNRDFNATLWFMNMRNRFKWGNGDNVDGQPLDTPKKVDVNINIKRFDK